MRIAMAIVGVLGALMSAAPPAPAGAQEAQAEAPTFTVGDWYRREDHGATTFVTAVSVDPSGIRFEFPASGYIHLYDPHLNIRQIVGGSWVTHFDPSLVRYSFPLYVGKTWDGVYAEWVEQSDGTKGAPSQVSYQCEVLCIERVTVPAGTFEAFNSTCEYTDLTDGSREREEYWFAPTAGISIKTIVEDFRPAEGWRSYKEVTLLDYEHAQSVEFSVLPDGVESTCNAAISMNELTP